MKQETAKGRTQMKIPISKPYFGEEERRAILEPFEIGWVMQGLDAG